MFPLDVITRPINVETEEALISCCFLIDNRQMRPTRGVDDPLPGELTLIDLHLISEPDARDV